MNVQQKLDPIAEKYASQTFVYFDLETIPCQDPDYLSVLERKVKAPGNIKKPESIQKWLDENRKEAATEALSKTSFDGGRGHICTIAWAKNDSPIAVRHAKTIADERLIIEDFFADLDPYHSETLVGHNITGFDIGFLRKRAIALGITMPSPQSIPRDPKPWDKAVFDTMSAWAGGTNRISMNELCDILGIQGKDEFDGSQVAGAWAAGEHDKIAEYCRDDVWRTREIHKRFIMAGF
jgi:DNA polymerase elongation subunit (family B)